MDAGILDVFGDGRNDDFPAGSHGVDFQFLGIFDKLADHYGILARYSRRFGQKSSQFFIVGRNGHRRAAKNVGRANQNRVPDAFRKCLRIIDVDQLSPFRLFDAELVQKR